MKREYEFTMYEDQATLEGKVSFKDMKTIIKLCGLRNLNYIKRCDVINGLRFVMHEYS